MKNYTWKISSGHLVPCGKQAWLDQIIKMFVLLRILNILQYDTIFLGNIFQYLTRYIWCKSFIFLYTRNFLSTCCLFLSSYRFIFSTCSHYIKRGIMFRLTLLVHNGWIDPVSTATSQILCSNPDDLSGFHRTLPIYQYAECERALDSPESLGESCRSQVTGKDTWVSSAQGVRANLLCISTDNMVSTGPSWDRTELIPASQPQPDLQQSCFLFVCFLS